MGFILFIFDLVYAAQFVICKFFMAKFTVWATRKGFWGTIYKLFTFFKFFNQFPGMLIILGINVLFLLMMLMSRRGKKIRNGSVRSVSRGVNEKPTTTNVIIGSNPTQMDDRMNLF